LSLKQKAEVDVGTVCLLNLSCFVYLREMLLDPSRIVTADVEREGRVLGVKETCPLLEVL
jgi:hypothetical protein